MIVDGYSPRDVLENIHNGVDQFFGLKISPMESFPSRKGRPNWEDYRDEKSHQKTWPILDKFSPVFANPASYLQSPHRIYILKLVDDNFYVGMTHLLYHRLKTHATCIKPKSSQFVFPRRPFEVYYVSRTMNGQLAIIAERMGHCMSSEQIVDFVKKREIESPGRMDFIRFQFEILKYSWTGNNHKGYGKCEGWDDFE